MFLGRTSVVVTYYQPIILSVDKLTAQKPERSADGINTTYYVTS